MRKIQTIFLTGSATQGRSFVKGLLDRMGTSGAISPLRDQRLKRTQSYLFALKEQQFVAPFASKRGGLVLLLFLISFGLGARLWFRRQRQGKQESVSSRTQGKLVPISSGTYGILIFFAFLLGLSIGARGWFRQRLQTERLALYFTSKRGSLTFLALFRRPLADEAEPAVQYSVATPFQSQFSSFAPTIVDAKSEPVVAPLLASPVVEQPESTSEPVPTLLRERPEAVASTTIDTHDEDTVKPPRILPPIVEQPESADGDIVKVTQPPSPVVSDPEAVDEDTITLPRPRPPIIVEPVSEPVVAPSRRQPQLERSPISFMRTGIIILILFVLLIGLGVAIVPRLRTSTPVPVAHLSTPTPVVRPPTPTSIPTTASVVYPTLAGAYQGTLYDVAARIGTNMSLTQIRQNQGKISGYFTVGSKLKGSGPFSGTIDTAHHVQFIVTDTTGHATLFFEGTMQSASSLTGNYYRCIQAQGNQCSRDPSGGYGLWNVVLA